MLAILETIVEAILGLIWGQDQGNLGLDGFKRGIKNSEITETFTYKSLDKNIVF